MTKVIGLRYNRKLVADRRESKGRDSSLELVVRLALEKQLNRLFDVKRENANQGMRVNNIVAVLNHNLKGKM